MTGCKTSGSEALFRQFWKGALWVRCCSLQYSLLYGKELYVSVV
jgi:hypothetical protein